MRMIALVLMTALPAAAETPLGADDFDRYTKGKTLEFSQSGALIGAEEYLSSRRVRWTFFDGECTEGRWYPEGDMICFVYEDIPGPQCWTFHLNTGGLTARFEGREEASEFYETRARNGPLQCIGPEIGA